MRVTRFNKSGFQIDSTDSLLPPPVENDRISFIEYRGRTVTVVTKLARSGDVFNERVVAVLLHEKRYEVFEELPERLCDRIGIAGEKGSRKLFAE